MTKKTKLLIALAAVLLAGTAAGGGWWLSRQTAPATAEAEPPKPAPDYKYVTLDKVLVMLRGPNGSAVSHYMAVDIVFKTLPEQEKRTKDHLPLLRTVAVKALSTHTVESAQAMSVEQFAQLLNQAYAESYAADRRDAPFAEALIGKLIIE
jgi:flagellar FliL protein